MLYHLRHKAILVLAMLALTACTVSLLPDYNEELHKGLNDANEKAQTLFSALETGATPQNFAKVEKQYHETIGQFSALLAQAKTRPQPNVSDTLERRLKQIPTIQKACATLSQEDGDPPCLGVVTPRALSEIVETLTAMRDGHKAKGLGSGTLEFLIGDYALSIEQALTVETALQ